MFDDWKMLLLGSEEWNFLAETAFRTIIMFIVITVVQFVVVAQGAGRVSEVAARFTLDAMPGKQMAIDADLNSGNITEAEARKRREAVAQEADFYGAMDGASKFVRGDAIAAVVITFVNILGGLYVGMVENNWELKGSAALYTKLTIGDGLVSQVPAFIVSLGAGLIVGGPLSAKLAERLGDRGVTVGQPQAALAPAVPTGRRLARERAEPSQGREGRTSTSFPAALRQSAYGAV